VQKTRKTEKVTGPRDDKGEGRCFYSEPSDRMGRKKQQGPATALRRLAGSGRAGARRDDISLKLDEVVRKIHKGTASQDDDFAGSTRNILNKFALTRSARSNQPHPTI
jgi:hypothetical protein